MKTHWKPTLRTPDPRTHVAGATSPRVIFFVLLVLVGGIGGITWALLHQTPPPPVPPVEKAPSPTEPTPNTPNAPQVTANPNVTNDPDFSHTKKGQKSINYTDRNGNKSVVETYPLQGDCTDFETGEPVPYFWLYLIPPDRGDIATASKSWTPNRFRNGQFAIEHQAGGTYNVLCESKEHDPWTGQVSVPFDGRFKIRLKRGNAIVGSVRDTNQTPIEGIEMQLVVDPKKIDGGADPPMQRLCKTDRMGRYSFNKVPSGTYGLQASLTGDVLATENEFRIDPGGTVVRDFMLPQLATLKLSVKNIADQPVTRARATLIQDRDGRERPVRTSYSDIKGVARLDFVREGSYKLRVVVQGFETWEQQVSVVAGEGFRQVDVMLQVAAKSGR